MNYIRVRLTYVAISLLTLCASCAHTHLPKEPQMEKNPCGMIIEATEITRVDISTGPIVAFKITAENAPARTPFVLMLKNLLSPAEPLMGYVSNDQGKIGYAHKQPLVVVATNTFPGEPYKLWLVSEDGEIAVSKTIVPYPLKIMAKDGANIYLTRENWNAYKTKFEGFGFEEEETLRYVLKGKNKEMASQIKCVEGSFNTSIFPPDTTINGEFITIELHRNSGEVLTLQYGWGSAAMDESTVMANTSKMQKEDFAKYEQEVQAKLDNN